MSSAAANQQDLVLNTNQQEFLSSIKAFELTVENEQRFVDKVSGQILVISEFSHPDIILLVPRTIDDKVLAISHRWDTSRMTCNAICVVHVPGDEDFPVHYWHASIDPDLQASLTQIPNALGNLWMDQICIPQKTEAFKNAQVQFMGKLYSEASSVICASNGTYLKPDVDGYSGRAWTQQEFSFGKVFMHPSICLTTQQKIMFLRDSFKNCSELLAVVSAACHHSEGLNWIMHAEMARIESFDRLIGDTNPGLKQQVHDLWDKGWATYDDEEILQMMERFRADCLWKGAELLGMDIFKRMFYVQCQFPKDQLFGVMGAAMFNASGSLLDYFDVEGSYLQVLHQLNYPLIIPALRDIHDGTAMSSPNISPLHWRTNDWNASFPPEEFLRPASNLYDISTDFPQRSVYGHHFSLNVRIQIWRFQRHESNWLGFGTEIARKNGGDEHGDPQKKRGKVAFSLLIEPSEIVTHKDLITSLLCTYLEDNHWLGGPHAWRFLTDFSLLLDELVDNGMYQGGGEDWLIN